MLNKVMFYLQAQALHCKTVELVEAVASQNSEYVRQLLQTIKEIVISLGSLVGAEIEEQA